MARYNAGAINVTRTNNEIENENSGTNIFTNTDTLTVLAGGTLTLLDDLVNNTAGAVYGLNLTMLDLIGGNTLNNGTFVNSGLFEATAGANVIYAAAAITNNSGVTLEVTGSGVTLQIDNANAAAFTNTGTLLATAGGELLLINDTVTDTSGKFEVDANSSLDLQTTTINNGPLRQFRAVRGRGRRQCDLRRRRHYQQFRRHARGDRFRRHACRSTTPPPHSPMPAHCWRPPAASYCSSTTPSAMPAAPSRSTPARRLS